MFTRYGYTTIGVAAIIFFIGISLSFFTNSNLLRLILIIIPLFFLIFSMNFFRDPERTPPQQDNVVVSPADGRVLFVKEVLDNKFINDKATQISIFMSPIDVHVNRIPIDGRVEYLKYYEGDYVAAFEDKASERNERAEFGIMSKYGKVFFTQVAGFVARRIIYEIKEGDEVKIGERFGMIKFGSRVDVVVPGNWESKVKKNDRVIAGETVLFKSIKR
ncbi:MAG: phosphatidylserine decarboxylase [Ignavibacteria bacterium GWA2_35_9]|nr:MAG: phosphatidylserine decarboxylase [Ignavibacteria bacterium GWA2_35_9]OGU48318.1 MAG: phosphatidylserine decarboxylase [Ignavibacteria bacterium GWC2_36_12]